MLKPLGDRVVIRVLEQEEKTASGIFLPDTAIPTTTLDSAWRYFR